MPDAGSRNVRRPAQMTVTPAKDMKAAERVDVNEATSVKGSHTIRQNLRRHNIIPDIETNGLMSA